MADSPPLTRRGPLIIDGEIAPRRSSGKTGRRSVRDAFPSGDGMRRYGIAAGAAALMLALVAVLLLAPDVSALPGVVFIEAGR